MRAHTRSVDIFLLWFIWHLITWITMMHTYIFHIQRFIVWLQLHAVRVVSSLQSTACLYETEYKLWTTKMPTHTSQLVGTQEWSSKIFLYCKWHQGTAESLLSNAFESLYWQLCNFNMFTKLHCEQTRTRNITEQEETPLYVDNQR